MSTINDSQSFMQTLLVVKPARGGDQTSLVARSIAFCPPPKQSSFASHSPSSLNTMHPHDVLHSTFVRDLKHTLIDFEFVFELASKRTRLSPNQLSTSPYSSQDGHPEQSSTLNDSSDWRERLKSSLLRPLDHCSPTTKQLTTNPQLSAWLDAVPYPRADSCPASPRIFSPSSCPSLSNYVEFKRPQSCEACFDLVRHKRSTNDSDSKPKRARLTLTTLQKMSQQESQFVENLVPWSNSSSNKAPDTLDATYIDTLYDHDIVMNLLGRKIPKELTPLKERILQKRSSPQLDDQAVFAIMNATKELAYNLEGPTNKILRTPMFPLEYDGLIKGENTQ